LEVYHHSSRLPAPQRVLVAVLLSNVSEFVPPPPPKRGGGVLTPFGQKIQRRKTE